MQKLKVKQGKQEEINKDIIRVHESQRIDESGRRLKSGLVCKVCIDEAGKDSYAILRGHSDENNIIIDEALRDKLKLKLGHKYQFIFKKAGWFGWIRWAWNASDPAYQISIRIAVILGILSIILSVL